MASDKNFSNTVAQHYNKVEQKGRRERHRSDIIDLRKFNNAMKSLMHFQAFKFAATINPSREPLRVLDLGCGKGGDLPKYTRNDKVGLVVGVDIADVSIEQAKERFREIDRDRAKKQFGGRRLKAEFFVADLTKEEISRKLAEINCVDKFHVASSQFSIHYSFESFDQAVRYISNAASNLMKHGIFIGTYPDGPKLLKLARLSQTPGLYEVGDTLSVEFSPEDLKNPKPFGTKYHFKLKEVVDCPEFLVHPEVLRSLMKSLGFYEVFDRSFEDHMKEVMDNPDRKQFKEIFDTHKALQVDFDAKVARLDEEMWSVASIYRCFCYRKSRDD